MVLNAYKLSQIVCLFLSCILPLRSICPENQLFEFCSKQEPPLNCLLLTWHQIVRKIRKEADLFPSILRIKRTWLSKIHWICLLCCWDATAGWYLVFLLGHSEKSQCQTRQHVSHCITNSDNGRYNNNMTDRDISFQWSLLILIDKIVNFSNQLHLGKSLKTDWKLGCFPETVGQPGLIRS